MNNAIYTVGRFQPPTIGHAVLIQTLLQIASQTNSRVFVFVSKTQDKKTNPLPCASKVNFLYKMFPNKVTFVDTSKTNVPSGGPVAAFEYLKASGYNNITLVSGEDREELFGPDARLWNYLRKDGKQPPRFMAIHREFEMSGTKARAYAMNGHLSSFRKCVKFGNMTFDDTDKLYNEIREQYGLRPLRNRWCCSKWCW